MALVDQQPAGLKSGNDLDNVDDPDAVEPAEIYMGAKRLTVLNDPPEPGDQITLMIKVECYEAGHGLRGDDEIYEVRKTKLIGCWKPGKKAAPSDPNQGTLVDVNDPDADLDTSEPDDE